MTPESENFEELRRLLALKRHEQPPPGYFTDFSAKVVARIEAAQEAAQLPWWRRAFLGLDAKPAMVCACSLAISGLVVLGLSVASWNDGVAQAELPSARGPVLVAAEVTPAPATAQVPTLTIAPPRDTAVSAMDPLVNPDSAPRELFPIGGFLGIRGVSAPTPVNLFIPTNH